MRIGLYSNPDKDPGEAMARRAASAIIEFGGVPVVDPDKGDSHLIGMEGIRKGTYNSCDVLMCFGGDGTFLSARPSPRQSECADDRCQPRSGRLSAGNRA